MSIESVMPSNHFILCCPLLLLPSSGSFPMSQLFCIRWPRYWSFSFSISPSSEYSGWFPLGLTDLIPCLGWSKLFFQGASLSSLVNYTHAAHGIIYGVMHWLCFSIEWTWAWTVGWVHCLCSVTSLTHSLRPVFGHLSFICSLLLCRQILYYLSHQGSPHVLTMFLRIVAKTTRSYWRTQELYLISWDKPQWKGI